MPPCNAAYLFMHNVLRRQNMHVDRKKFDALVQSIARQVIDELPADLRENAERLIFVVEDKYRSARGRSDSDEDDLLGLYEGIPLTERSVSDTFTGPERITIFRAPLIEMCHSLRELREEIRVTIIHEMGHYFGFDEDDLEERGLE